MNLSSTSNKEGCLLVLHQSGPMDLQMVGLFLCLEQFCLKNVGHCRVLCICVGGDIGPPPPPPIGRERIGIDTLVLILILHHFIRSTHKSRYPLIYQRRLWPQFPTVNNNFTLFYTTPPVCKYFVFS